jgi:serine phosphatase RsbU (regulator of sigma subunit)
MKLTANFAPIIQYRQPVADTMQFGAYVKQSCEAMAVKAKSTTAVKKNRNLLDSWVNRLSGAFSLPSDTEELRLRKAVLILLVGIYMILGIVWGGAYLALGRPLSGSIPLGYSAISGASLYYFFQSKRYKFFCRTQLAMILILPFLLQWSLGGFAASGAVIIWSILSPIGALMFAGTGRSIPWFGAYVLLMLFSVIPDVEPIPPSPLPAVVIAGSFAMNIGGVSAIAFLLLSYFVQAREQAMRALDQEHRRVRQSLSLAMEVQQNLLPKETPVVEGLDIAGRSIYCDETGGDYYDFLDVGESREGKIGVVVGDVSDHGIPSALLMATVRALIRQRCAPFGNIDGVVADVNRHLAQDVKDTGRFMTLFYAEIDRQAKKMRWLNAGHEPAIVYSPATDTFDELAGGGNLPLGIFIDTEYRASQNDIAAGQIVVIATDGLYEAVNPQGEMFGKERFYRIIRQNASAKAAELQDSVFQSLDHFRKDIPPQDDMTVVVIKIEPDE